MGLGGGFPHHWETLGASNPAGSGGVLYLGLAVGVRQYSSIVKRTHYDTVWFHQHATSPSNKRCPLPDICWFGTFFIFPYIGKNHPNWLIFFTELKPPTSCSRFLVSESGLGRSNSQEMVGCIPSLVEIWGNLQPKYESSTTDGWHREKQNKPACIFQFCEWDHVVLYDLYNIYRYRYIIIYII